MIYAPAPLEHGRAIFWRMDPYQDKVAAIVHDALEMIQTYRERRELSHEELAKKAKSHGPRPTI